MNKVEPRFAWLVDRCPRLAHHLDEPDYADALALLLKLPALRPGEAWQPAGGGGMALFRSLASHRLALFPVPDFLWSGFFGRARHLGQITELIQVVASGGSLVELVKAGRFPTPLSRAMCHDFLQSPPERPFLEALRRAQLARARALPGRVEALLATDWGRDLFSPALERFWAHLALWLVEQPGLEPAQVGPLCDLALHRYVQNASYSLTGRSVPALLREMEAWHKETAQLHLAGRHRTHDFETSGFADAEVRVAWQGQVETWRVTEILTSEGLVAEGWRQRHCVVSYLPGIRRGYCSIWSMARVGAPEGESLTVEVRNATGQIVQARGHLNRLPTETEHAALAEWARVCGLTLALYRQQRPGA